MDKQQIISFIQSQLQAGKITKQDVLQAVGESGGSVSVESAPKSNVSMSKRLIHIFYGIGAIIAVVGVCILVGQNWRDIGFIGRIAVTAGISLITYVAALLIRGPEHRMMSQVMFTISAALAPLGAFVLLDEAGFDFDLSYQIITACVLLVIYGVALFVSRRSLLILITIGFATWAYYAGVLEIFDVSFRNYDLVKWATMLIGAAYILIGTGYHPTDKEGWSVKSVLYGLGTLGFLGGGIWIGGIFDLLLIALIFGTFYLSVYLRSRMMLILSALFLIAHIMKITSKYFAQSVSWPVALIVVGFLVIGIGYMTYYVSKKYISTNQ